MLVKRIGCEYKITYIKMCSTIIEMIMFKFKVID